MDKNTLKSWFTRGKKPLASQFAAWMDSYWHKDEKLPISSIENLSTALAAKMSTSDSLPLRNSVMTTRDELLTARNSSLLVPGTWYRINDYVTIIDSTNVPAQSAGKPFDILVLATSVNTLSEECRATANAFNNPFIYSNLNAWKVWYTIDNNKAKYDWANAETGKGVIYRLIDEWGNDCPYDFKNIQFKRYKITACDIDSFVGSYSGTINMFGEILPYGTNTEIDQEDFVWCYTFVGHAYNVTPESGEWTLFKVYEDVSSYNSNTLHLGEKFMTSDERYLGCQGNIIQPNNKYGGDGVLQATFELNNIVLFGSLVLPSVEYSEGYDYLPHNNLFGLRSRDMSLGVIGSNLHYYGARHNKFDSYCSSFVTGSQFEYNKFGAICEHFTCGSACGANVFGNLLSSAVFFQDAYYNVIGDSCSITALGTSFRDNTMSSDSYSNIFQGVVSYCKFDGRCSGNTFAGDLRKCSFYGVSNKDFTAITELYGKDYTHTIGLGASGKAIITWHDAIDQPQTLLV